MDCNDLFSKHNTFYILKVSSGSHSRAKITIYKKLAKTKLLNDCGFKVKVIHFGKGKKCLTA